MLWAPIMHYGTGWRTGSSCNRPNPSLDSVTQWDKEFQDCALPYETYSLIIIGLECSKIKPVSASILLKLLISPLIG